MSEKERKAADRMLDKYWATFTGSPTKQKDG